MSAVEVDRDTRVPSRMTRRALEDEVQKLRRDIRSSQRPAVVRLRNALRNERELRVEAERNARNFHALLIAERVKNLPRNTNGSGHAHSEGAREAGATGGEV